MSTTRDESRRAWGYGVTVTALVLAIVILGAINLRRWWESRGQSREISQATTSEASPDATAGVRSARPEEPAPSGAQERSGAASSEPAGEPPAGSGGEAPAGPNRGADRGAGGGDEPRDRQPAPTERMTSGLHPQPAGPATKPGAGEALAPAAPGEKNAPGEETSPPADGGSDRTPPWLASIRFDPPVVEGGSATTLTIQATDNLSGVKSVRGEIQSPSGKATLPLYLQEIHGGNAFTYVLNIPPSAETGVWFVKWLSLTDVADNSALTQVAAASAAPPGGTFSVSSSESDSIAPDVIEISFDKDVLEEEDSNVVRVEVRDDLSGVASVTGACQSPSRSALIPFTCALDEDSGLWRGEIA